VNCCTHNSDHIQMYLHMRQQLSSNVSTRFIMNLSDSFCRVTWKRPVRKQAKNRRKKSGTRNRRSRQKPVVPDSSSSRHDTSSFRRLVLGCINTDSCNQTLIFSIFRDLKNYLAEFSFFLEFLQI